MGPLAVLSPVPGRVVPLAEVPDPVFAGALVGPGSAIDPQRGPITAVAPVSGRLTKLYPHAFVTVTREGRGVLVHLGIDTVHLKGKGFRLLVAEDDDVEAGQPVVEWDPAAVEAGGHSPMVPVIALDTPPETLVDAREPGPVGAGEKLFTWA